MGHVVVCITQFHRNTCRLILTNGASGIIIASNATTSLTQFWRGIAEEPFRRPFNEFIEVGKCESSLLLHYLSRGMKHLTCVHLRFSLRHDPRRVSCHRQNDNLLSPLIRIAKEWSLEMDNKPHPYLTAALLCERVLEEK